MVPGKNPMVLPWIPPLVPLLGLIASEEEEEDGGVSEAGSVAGSIIRGFGPMFRLESSVSGISRPMVVVVKQVYV